MAFQEKQLAQKRENSISAVSVYSPAANTTAIIKAIVLCNQSTSRVTFRLFIDDDGTTYDESTQLYQDTELLAKTTMQIDTYWPMNNTAGNLAYRSSIANALTITVFGVEIT